jgi:hypothetical protein
MPQTQMVCSEDGQLLVDFVGKFEQLQQDFEHVCAQLGIEKSKLPHVNSSDKKSRELRRKFKNFIHRNDETELRSYVDFYDDETRDLVARMYQSDIEMFNYRFSDALPKHRKEST